MDDFKKAIAGIIANIGALFKVKSLLTVILTIVFSILALRGAMEPKDVLSVFLMIVSFYFGTQTKKE